MDEKRPAYTAASYTSSVVRLYGLPITAAAGSINFGGLEVQNLGAGVAPTFHRKGNKSALNPGIIFGYGFQGYCYGLEKPKIMLMSGTPSQLKTEECGFSTSYHVWEVDRLDQCLAIDVSEGRVEELVLEANMPGTGTGTTYRGALQSYRGAMQSYRGAMQVAHRGGRLTE